jgi:sec-independent protein translocase protein TatA
MIWKLLIVLAIVLLIFGPGRISKVMGDMGKGIKSFKDGLGGDNADKKEDK